MSSSDLHQPLKAINQTIARAREDIQKLTGEVKKIPAVIRESTETLRDAIHENIRAQAELKLMEHIMEVKSVKPQIEAEYEQITTEQEELDARLERIDERYQGKHAELDERANERVRDLGSHIFEIDEQEFEAGVEDPFTEQVTTTWGNLAAHNEMVRDERQDKVKGTAGEVVQDVHDFIGRQEELLGRIQDHRFDTDTAVPSDETTSIEVPYYVVEYESDGITERRTVVPSTLSNDGDGWCAASLTPIEGADSLLSGVDSVSDGESTTVSGQALANHLSPYGESKPLGLSYASAVRDAVSRPVPVTVEGGED